LGPSATALVFVAVFTSAASGSPPVAELRTRCKLGFATFGLRFERLRD
jgi:hypothetical protein